MYDYAELALRSARLIYSSSLGWLCRKEPLPHDPETENTNSQLLPLRRRGTVGRSHQCNAAAVELDLEAVRSRNPVRDEPRRGSPGWRPCGEIEAQPASDDPPDAYVVAQIRAKTTLPAKVVREFPGLIELWRARIRAYRALHGREGA